jgi:WhiB family redox-sensing transcriptional regulator
MVQGNICVTTVHCGQSGVRPGGRGSAAGGAGLVVDRNWRDRAACRSADPELFFPVGNDGPALVQIAAAKAVCAACPVVAECLSFALVALPEGVAGGLTVQERRKRRRASRSPVAGAAKPFGRLPGGVDELVVARLMAGERVPGASRQELAHAAVGLHLSGHGCGWIGTRLGVADRQVSRWLQRHRAGQPMVPRAGRRRAGAAVAS